MKNTLVQIGDVKQLQKVCLTPVDEYNALLKEPPTLWDAIKAGKFMIINGQHSTIASQELQAGGCGEPRCRSTKTQVNPSSALNRIKHHQSNPSNVPGILDSNLSKRACVFS